MLFFKWSALTCKNVIFKLDSVEEKKLVAGMEGDLSILVHSSEFVLVLDGVVFCSRGPIDINILMVGDGIVALLPSLVRSIMALKQNKKKS